VENIKDLLKAKIKSIYIQSYEYERFQAKIVQIADELGKELYFFNDAKGLFKFENKNFKAQDEEDIIEVLEDIKPNSIYVFEEVHSYFNDERVVNRFKYYIRDLKNSHIIFFCSILNIPKELEKEIVLVDMPLPNIKDLEKLANHLAKEFGVKAAITETLLKSLLGLTIKEATNAISYAIVKNGKLTIDEIDILVSQKEQIIKKSGFLEYYHPNENLDSIGGLDKLKEWLKIRQKAFLPYAKKYKLQAPKGIMLLGIPGTGKSLSAKAVASTWRMPLLRLDFGKIFGGVVGESESNIREAIKIAEGLSPCILWIDEIEKGLSGLNSGGDSGVSSRVFGTFLTWMQEKQSEVFVIATANNISNLPPELLRKGRFDEIFFVDLPVFEERKEIIEITLKNLEQDTINIDEIAKITVGFSGAEIVEVINEALFNVFDGNDKKPILKTRDIKEVIKDFYPLSTTMKENILSLRKWAKARTKLASKYENGEEITTNNTPKLKQEINNIFMEE